MSSRQRVIDYDYTFLDEDQCIFFNDNEIM